MPPEFEKYRKFVSHLGLSEKQENELMFTVHCMMESCVDLAFGKDSVQHVIKSRTGKYALELGHMIELKATRNSTNQKSGNALSRQNDIHGGESP